MYLGAALICFITLFVHAFLGGIDTLNPMMSSTIAMEVRVAMMAVWHGLSLFFILSVIAFVWAFRVPLERARPVGLLLGSFYLLFAVVFATLSYVWFEDFMVLPQWTLLAPIGLFALIASL